ncbi:hypothetical protein K788_00005285 [Paraburkholderia caribensis MBA4]|uniref:Uncharacterized protein n=1 Tax=Paraburkholderia caribensis MBA4 TaxID=1323664 RepID=A0A0P0RGU6_9BURK|nr:hypothetical protein K788_00005285 [Paraburkholderia caribensis MBA4]
MGPRTNKFSGVAVRGGMYAVRETQNFNAFFTSEYFAGPESVRTAFVSQPKMQWNRHRVGLLMK